jgi:hypothetical protein
MKRWLGTGIFLTTLAALSQASAEATSLSVEDKLAGGDDSFVVTWSATDAAADEGAGEIPALTEAAPTGSHLEFVAFSSACRFLDTRIAGGAFAKNESRDLGVLDANIPVGLGPCGVPARAKAVLLSLSAIKGSSTAAGIGKVGPGGGIPSPALQFAAGQGSTGTVVVPLNAASQIRVNSGGAAAGYMGDLLGYYQAPVLGRVSADGTLAWGSGVTSITKSGTWAGDYYIYTDRTLSPGCAAAVYVEDSTTRALGYVSSNYIYVDLRAYNSTAEQDGNFEFAVQCR